MMYEKVSTSLDFAGREQAVLDFWAQHRIFEASIKNREGGPVFTFYDGPPTANGKPHIGHILTRAIKDIIPRYKTMKGYHVRRKAGWDTHGLPVELEVEKQLGISGKPDIEKFGVEPFIAKCKDSVWTYESLWRVMSERVGFWADMDDPYVTYHNHYIESVWWALSQIWQKGLIYKGHRVVPYCPRCGTPLSSHEVAQGYKDVKETSVFVKFRVKGKDNEFFLAWTTTPWTLPSNVALCVNAKERYARVAYGDAVFIMAEALLVDVLQGAYTVLETMQGAALVGSAYEPLFNFAELGDAEGYCTVVADDYVTLTDGTGIVHIAPAFGEDDARIGKTYQLPFVQLVNEQGCFVEAAKPWAGCFVKDADPAIIADLHGSGALYKAVDYAHSYPFCWRCDTPLLYYAREAWFIRVTALRDRLVANNNTVNWLPDHIRTGRFGNFLENVIDWSVSRERYWGTPLPIWECKGTDCEPGTGCEPSVGCGHRHCVSGIEELKRLGKNVPDDIELHKPYIDQVVLTCEKCGGEMRRVPEVIDCWFDSGAMPFAQWHYPFENKALFEENFPADFISEAVDQTRGWFYSLMAIATMLFDRAPFKHVIVMGHVQDANGQKMSKHLGNVVDPMTALAKHGADALRWYFYIGSAPWLPSRYFDEAVTEAQRKFMGTLWNTYAFYVLYAEIDQFDPARHTRSPLAALTPMDRWILSRLNTLIKKVDGCLERYELTEPARALNDFADDLSNWYVRRCRERFWGKDMPQDKVDAYMTLHEVLTTTAKLAAPFVPFMAEQMYRNLVCASPDSAVSVHLCDYPVADEAYIDAVLEREMDKVLRIVALGRAARNAANVKNRQPLAEMLVKIGDGGSLESAYAAIVAEELNVKTVTFTDSVEAYTVYKFKPQLRTLGPRYGKRVPKITEALNADARAAWKTLSGGGVWRCVVEGEDVALTEADVLVEVSQREGYAAQAERDTAVVLDIRLTPALVEEGYVRELVSKLQTMRKEAGFDVMDRIVVWYGENKVLSGVITRHEKTIAAEVLADRIAPLADDSDGYEKAWSINNERLVLKVARVYA